MMRPLFFWMLPCVIALAVLRMPTAWSAEPAAGAAQEQVLPQAVSDIHSDDPSVYLNYASILFYNGQQLLRGGKSEEAHTVFRNAEQALDTVLRLSETDPDRLRRSLVRSQASFLLGELNSFVLGDKKKAKTLYEDALKECPKHTAAAAALMRVLMQSQ